MKTVCIKARALRTIGYDNIKEWDEGNDNHIAAVRRGRVPVNGVAYVHKKSKWCNGKSLEVSDYYDSLVESTDREEAITELSGKIVGCFCLEALLPTPKLEDCVCHVQALRHFVEDVPILPEPVYDAVRRCFYLLGLDRENHGTDRHNERLEYLGDAVLEFLVSKHLFTMYPDRAEGDLTSFRSAVVKTETLADVSRQL